MATSPADPWAGRARLVVQAVEDRVRSEPGAPDDAALAASVARLSDLYTVDRGSLRAEQARAEHLAAKRGYFLASDAPKVALALAECAERGGVFRELPAREALRVVDLGAGVGATSVGLLAWLAGARASAAPMRVSLHAVELGEPAARAYETSVRAAAEAAGIELALSIEARDFRRFELPGACDLVLCQTALNELLAADTHTDETVAMVARWASAAPMLVIEPALRTTTRALMALRDALLARGAARVVAPCPHQGPCPMRARDADWCHEARRIEPTPRVAAIDRIVGRRDERALFSFLATEPRSAATAQAAPGLPMALRVVTDCLGSRGKTERLVCRGDGELRLMRLLDREARAGNQLFLDAPRGAMLAVDPLPPNDRIGPDAAVFRIPFGG